MPLKSKDDLDEIERAASDRQREEPVLAMDEIQGNVIPGFNKDHVLIVVSADR